MRECLCRDPENWTAKWGRTWELNYWNHALVGLSFRDRFARRDDLEAFNACSSSFRRPYTEVGSLLYVLIGMLSTTSTILLLRSFRSSVREKREAKMFNQGAAGAVGPLDPGSCLTRPGLEVERRFVSLREESPAGLLMKFLSHLFDNNRKWAAEIKRRDPEYFERLSKIQKPVGSSPRHSLPLGLYSFV